jgi:hypothetical protein
MNFHLKKIKAMLFLIGNWEFKALGLVSKHEVNKGLRVKKKL